MPSPIAHSATGYVLAKLLPTKQFKFHCHKKWERIVYPIFVATAADFDFIPQLITGETFHRGLTHSLIFCLGFSAIAGAIASYFWQLSYKKMFLLTLILYGSHLFLDLFSPGRGMQLLLPFTDNFFKSPIAIFPRVHHSDGLWNSRHLFPIVFESIYSVFLILGLWQYKKVNNQKSKVKSQQ
jgi:inner membrane protein